MIAILSKAPTKQVVQGAPERPAKATGRDEKGKWVANRGGPSGVAVLYACIAVAAALLPAYLLGFLAGS